MCNLCGNKRHGKKRKTSYKRGRKNSLQSRAGRGVRSLVSVSMAGSMGKQAGGALTNFPL